MNKEALAHWGLSKQKPKQNGITRHKPHINPYAYKMTTSDIDVAMFTFVTLTSFDKSATVSLLTKISIDFKVNIVKTVIYVEY